MKNKIISVINQNGGVGKTTTVVNLAASLSILGQKTLVIDLDPQGNATTGLGKSNTINEKNIYSLLIGKLNSNDVIETTNVQNLELISSTVTYQVLKLKQLLMKIERSHLKKYLMKIKIF